MIIHDGNVRSLNVTIDDTNIDRDVYNVDNVHFNNTQLNLSRNNITASVLTMTSGDYVYVAVSKVMSNMIC